jgi:ketosteroid isomerase-like protein
LLTAIAFEVGTQEHDDAIKTMVLQLLQIKSEDDINEVAQVVYDNLVKVSKMLQENNGKDGIENRLKALVRIVTQRRKE